MSVLRTEGESDTTELLATIAKREQETRDREVSVHGEKTAKTRAEQQEYVVSSIADIGRSPRARFSNTSAPSRP